MKDHRVNEEIQWEILKAMMDEFPVLRNKVKTYIEEKER